MERPLDRAFVNGMDEGRNTEIIRAIVSLAAGLAMDVTAEGIETAEQVDRLQALACEFGQGYYFDEPLTRADARAILEQGAQVNQLAVPQGGALAPR